MSKLVKELAKVLKKETTKEVKPYDTSAKVVRIEGGTAWVHIPGGVDETPVDLTINAQVGDTVQLRVAGGNAWLVGNKTAPPTDDRVAIQAQGTADVANVAAQNAVKSADNAEAAAQSALASATTAATAATNAQNSANAAQASATNANEYATRALNGLSAVESVTETLTWITAHGTMTLTTDVTLDPTHVYFVVDPLGDYDVGGTHYSLVIDPDVNDIGTYYELSIDESLNNYVGTHLALDTEGLWLLPASSGTNKVLIATGAGSTYTTAGTYIIDSGGGTVASFRANGATIGEVLNGRTRTEIGSGGMKIIRRDSEGDKQLASFEYGRTIGSNYMPFCSIGNRITNMSDAIVDYYGETNPLVRAYDSSTTYQQGMIVDYNHEYYMCISPYGASAGKTPPDYTDIWKYIPTASGTVGGYSIAAGENVIAEGKDSSALGNWSFAFGDASHAEGGVNSYQQVSGGARYPTNIPTAFGHRSHAESRGITLGDGSHAENAGLSKGELSHAEGENTWAIGKGSHSGGLGTYADQNYQTAVGKYNTKNNTNNLFVVGKGTADNVRSDGFTVDTSGNTYTAGDVNIGSGKHYKINGTNLGAGDVSAVALADKYKRSSAGELDWSGQSDGDAKVIAKSALAFWNGAYSGNSSNLSKCSTGSIVGTNGATMTGQLQTSFQPYASPSNPISVAMGSYGSNQTTVDGLAGEIRYSSGAAGSASINTAYTKSGVTIPTGWYNFFYMPHRTGGKNGSSDGDNTSYGNMFLFGMNNTNGQFIVRISSGSVAEVVKLVTTASVISESKLLKDNVTINANSYGNGSLNVSKTNYTPIGIVGMHLENASSSGVNNTYCACHSFYLSGSTAYWIVKNNHTSSAKIKVTATILYVAS